MRKIGTFFFCFLLSTVLLASAKKTIPELQKQLSNELSDSVKIALSHKLSFLYSIRNVDSSIYYLNQAISLAEKAGLKEAKIESIYKLSRSYQLSGDIEKQKELVQQMISLAKEPGMEKWLGRAYWRYGDFARDALQSDSAQYYYLKAIDDISKYDDPYNSWLIYTELGWLYALSGRHQNAEEQFLKAVEITKEKAIRRDYGLALFHQLRYYNSQKKYDKASDVMETYLNFMKGKEKGLANSLLHARFFSFKKTDSQNYKIEQLDLMLQEHFENKNYLSFLSTALKQCRLLRDAKRYDELITISKQALSIAKEKNSTLFILDFTQGLNETYAMKGDFASAYPYLEMGRIIEDSLNQVQIQKNMDDLELKHEKAKNEKLIAEQQIALAKQKYSKQLISIIAISGVLLAAAALWLLYFRSRTNRELTVKNKQIHGALEEKKVLLKEIHHRVKNNLQVISSLLSLQSKYIKDPNAIMAINEGRNRVRSMALIHQNLYQKDHLTGVSVRNYFDRLVGELFETYRIDEGKIQLKTKIEDLQLDIDTIVPLGLMLNELVSNALKYAFPNAEKGTLTIRLFEENEALILSVQDDGVGMDASYVEGTAESFGFKLIQAFTAKLEGDLQLNTDNGTHITLRITDYKLAA